MIFEELTKISPMIWVKLLNARKKLYMNNCSVYRVVVPISYFLGPY